jgi:mevalonate kinase
MTKANHELLPEYDIKELLRHSGRGKYTPRIAAHAPGKVILFGEHAVVYGRPAIAAPVTQVRAQVTVEPVVRGAGLTLFAHDLGQSFRLGDPADRNDPATEAMRPLELVVRQTLARLERATPPDIILHLRSTVPIGRGMGSGAAVATAIVRALSRYLGAGLSPADISALVYQSEVLLHGTPSGIDNTVVAYEQPVYFMRGQPIELFQVGRPFRLVIADTGVFSLTKVAVGDVRAAWEQDRARYEALFDAIGQLAARARAAIQTGDQALIGRLMNENQALLRQIAVSSPELERLIEAALAAGALGAKLVGAGRGGNMIALVIAGMETTVVAAMQRAGAANVLVTQVG